MVQGRIHTVEERYFGAASELIPLTTRKGTCTYVNMHPYILELYVCTFGRGVARKDTMWYQGEE